MPEELNRAVVIGGSLAGVFCARALSDHFNEVIVLERDTVPTSIAPRKGVPQSPHIHVLLKGGEQAIASLFPGILDELVASGGHCMDFAGRGRWYHHHCWKARFDSGFMMYVQSRPFLEWHIRQRVARLPNVTFYYETTVTSLIAGADNQTIEGINYSQDGVAKALQANLVVDATGRATKTPQWLAELGYVPPTESQFELNLRYASRMVQPKKAVDWQLLIVYPKMPESARLGAIAGVEDGKWQVTLFGYIGDHPPYDDEGFLKFAEQLASPDIYEALQEATPLTDIKIYNVKEEVRRHYEKLQRFPEGLIVVGDAACSFDPVFGQGMTVAAKEALALDQLLQKSNGRLTGFPQKFHKRIARIIDIPWLLATSEIRRLPQVGGKRPLWLKLLHWYNGNIFELSATVPEVYASFLKVMHLTTGPQALFHPKIVWRVLKHSLRRKPGAARTTAARPANISLGD